MVKFKPAGIATKLLVLVLLVAGVIAIFSVQSQLRTAKERRDLLVQQVEEQENTNNALSDDITNSNDPAYLANIARSKLGLLFPDEIKFVDTSN